MIHYSIIDLFSWFSKLNFSIYFMLFSVSSVVLLSIRSFITSFNIIFIISYIFIFIRILVSSFVRVFAVLLEVLTLWTIMWISQNFSKFVVLFRNFNFIDQLFRIVLISRNCTSSWIIFFEVIKILEFWEMFKNLIMKFFIFVIEFVNVIIK